MRTLLIANRGEIACRVMRTARRMGVRTVAVYSDADAQALHVAMADMAVRLGPAPARESYLDIARIMDAARRTNADAIHPGYGFLSENPALPDACAVAGIAFVGPPASAMRAMGSKAAAKALMERAGVPVLPGYHGDDQNPEFLAEAAARAGFPVVIKAVAGGGGRGMRVAHGPDDFALALSAAQQEGASSFGDDRVLIERYVTRPRHIEVQVFADSHGAALHLWERDCSAQRRHQKVIEEAPAPGLAATVRDAMGWAAVQAAQAVGYVGAGTVEFVADETGFYFLEMNTRLQVEHPVTEAITGLDLVEWQLRVADGERLPLTQSEITRNGHAMEARLYAEDPARDYAPSVGRLAAFRMPDWTRVDTGVRAGDAVSVHYDAMLAKVIVHGTTREEARARLIAALADCDVAGVATNLDLLGRIAAHPAFAAGGIDTGFIGRHADTLLAGQGEPDALVLAVAALGIVASETDTALDPGSPWNASDGWWLNATPTRTLSLADDVAVHAVGLTAAGSGWIVAAPDPIAAAFRRLEDGRLDITLDGVRVRAGVTVTGTLVTVRLDGRTWRFRLPDAGADDDDEAAAGGRLVAPLPGQVTQVLAEPGAAVARGDVLVVLEAMKTVFRLTAPADGVIAGVACRTGETVQDGQTLVTFAEPA